MSNNLLISIIVVTKSNYEDLLLTLASVVKLEFESFEIIVINGSKDDYEVPDSYKRVLNLIEVHDEGSGIYNAMNLGIDHVKGSYVIFMNAGDRFSSPYVLTHVKDLILDNKKVDVLCGATIRVDGKHGVSSVFWPRPIDTLFYGMIACHQSMYYRSEVLLNKKFNEDDCLANDWKHLLMLYKAGCNILITTKIFSLFDMSGVSSQNFLKLLYEQWRYARNISSNKSHIDRVYIKRFKRKVRKVFTHQPHML